MVVKVSGVNGGSGEVMVVAVGGRPRPEWKSSLRLPAGGMVHEGVALIRGGGGVVRCVRTASERLFYLDGMELEDESRRRRRIQLSGTRVGRCISKYVYHPTNFTFSLIHLHEKSLWSCLVKRF